MPENQEVPEGTPPSILKDIFTQIISGSAGPAKVEPSSDIRVLAENFGQFVTAFTDQGFSRKEAIMISTEFFTNLSGTQG